MNHVNLCPFHKCVRLLPIFSFRSTYRNSRTCKFIVVDSKVFLTYNMQSTLTIYSLILQLRLQSQLSEIREILASLKVITHLCHIDKIIYELPIKIRSTKCGYIGIIKYWMWISMSNKLCQSTCVCQWRSWSWQEEQEEEKETQKQNIKSNLICRNYQR